jgi:hypothetical protein
MISTFNLILLGSLVSAGGLVFLRQAKRPHLGWRWLDGRQAHHSGSTPESRERLERSVTIAGTRWLTVGALTLFLAYAHGSEEGYLIGSWSDVMFHVTFVASCWGITAFGIKRKAETPTGQTNDSPIATVSLPDPRLSRTSD